MDPERYDRLVAKLEAVAKDSPGSLKRRVRLLIALGYAYVLLVLARSSRRRGCSSTG